MKIKIFTEYDEPRDKKGYCEVSLEKRINDFIKGKKVVDIKYQSNISLYATDYVRGFKTIERALVMYEDQPNFDDSVRQFRDNSGDSLRSDTLQTEKAELVAKNLRLRDLLSIIQFRATIALDRNLGKDQLIDVLREIKECADKDE